MTSAETILQQAAADGSLESAEWPKTLQYILDRLDEIIDQFPKPPAGSTTTPDPDVTSRTQHAVSSQESHTTDKENAPPVTPSRPPVPTFAASTGAHNLPQDMTNFYSSIRNTLSTNFAKHPPHTVQRLAELVLESKRRYKFLPPYLRALDRIVSVSSPLTIFPLPQAVLPTAGGLLNGTTTPTNSQSFTLGSDESLGGALLTPIPWLQNRAQNELISESTELVDGPNGQGRIETVTVGMLRGDQRQETSAQISSAHPDGETLPSTGPVTQGELLRQEQEAGIVLNNPHTLTTSPTRIAGEMDGGGSVLETVESEEETPHARGPEEIGMEDTGPQKKTSHLDIEGAVGRPSVERSSKSPGPSASIGDDKKDEDMQDSNEKDSDETTNNPDSEKISAAKDKQDVDMNSEV